MATKIILLVLFFSVSIGVGVWCRRRSRTVNGFVLGGRDVGPWLTAFAYGTSYFSAVIFVGYAGQFGYNFGVAATWIGLGNAFIGSLLAWVILGRRTRVMTQHLGSRTMPDYFSLRYGSPALKTAASAITFVFLIPYTASLFNGLSRLFAMAFPGVDYAVCVVAMAVLTAVYVVVGGYMATAVNDFIQGMIMLVGIVAVILAVLGQNGGLMASLASMSQIPAETEHGTFFGAYTSLLGPKPLALLGVVLLTSLGTWGLPQMVGKFYAIKNEDAVRKGTVISTVFAVVVAGGCYFLGGFARLFADDSFVKANGFDAIIPRMLERLPDLLIAVVLILVLSASMSTLSSLVLTSSSTLTLDFIAPMYKKKELTEKNKMLCLRIFIAVFILISAAIAILQAKSAVAFIAQLMGVSWGALAGAFLAPFLYGLFARRITVASVWASFACGVGIMLAELVIMITGATFRTGFMQYFFGSPINAGVLAMLAGLVTVPLVSLVTKKPKAEHVEAVFACYDKEVSGKITESLGD